MKKAGAILLVAFLVLSFATISFAEGKRAGTKLERGVKNIALGWTEIPKTIVDTSKKQNFIVGLTVGTVKGVLNAFARTVSGTVDVATFPSGTYDRPAVKPAMTEEGSSSGTTAGAKGK